MKQLSGVQVPVVAALPTPTSALAGVTMRLSSDNKPYWCTGAAWVDIGQYITVATTAPASPALNDLWLDIT